ncbi:phage tail protein [Nocardioides sp. Bht2]|uniref:phage tail protein n=1 Tax=Nocardioides sp. Bht2 TaxID=3392297 RepID=UPI0039B61ACB
MANPYIGEVRLFAGNFPPAGWKFCNGELLPISEYETLFQLIGTTYGGDGETTFRLPDLQSRVPIHQGNGYVIGETGGAEEVTLTTPQLPVHNHTAVASAGVGTLNSPAGALPASGPQGLYSEGAGDAVLAASAVTAVGGSQPHENRQPFVALNYVISLFGIWPSQT